MSHALKKKKAPSNYPAIAKMDGSHPFQKAVPESCVFYSARQLPKGRITYFNFELAKEMGLISQNHPNHLNKELEKTLLSTFNLRIINEYDILNKTHFKPEHIKKNKYMATRYLQIQHKNKQGGTSGDGRCIWNGCIRHKGKTWDISSRGTGVTSLSPRYQIDGKPLKSAADNGSYGCGRAELDELYSTAIYSEIFKQKNIPTERVLLIIDHGKGYGIGVRAGVNLFRPAHMFVWLKQNKLDSLRRITDFIIKHTKLKKDEINLKKFNSKELQQKKVYEYFTHKTIRELATAAAIYERNYIFIWMAWDGDNVLLNGGVIDYGSIRHFGIRHDQYRYDDVERWSTNLNEQRRQFRVIAQTFIQIHHFLKTKKKKSFKEFSTHPSLQIFDKTFEQKKLLFFLRSCGFSDDFIQVKKNMALKSKFLKYFEELEKEKSSPTRKVMDGTNAQPLFNMRKFPLLILEQIKSQKNFTPLDPEIIYKHILHINAPRSKKHPSQRLYKKIAVTQKLYIALIQKYQNKLEDHLQKMINICKKENPRFRLTGNGVIHMTDDLISLSRKRHLNIQKVLQTIYTSHERIAQGGKPKNNLIEEALSINLFDYNEEI